MAGECGGRGRRRLLRHARVCRSDGFIDVVRFRLLSVSITYSVTYRGLIQVLQGLDVILLTLSSRAAWVVWLPPPGRYNFSKQLFLHLWQAGKIKVSYDAEPWDIIIWFSWPIYFCCFIFFLPKVECIVRQHDLPRCTTSDTCDWGNLSLFGAPEN